MKARLAAPPKRLAAGINISDEKERVVIDTVLALGGSYIKAPSDCGEQQLGYVFGLPGFGENEARLEISGEMLIFSGFDSSTLNKAVTTLRAKGCIIPIKAIVTDHNKNWQVKALAAELLKEHEYMKSLDKAAKKLTAEKSEQDGDQN